MRAAFIGKGGAGKSVLAGTFARVLARWGEPVLAVDSDPMPGLSLSLGLGVLDACIPDDAVDERAAGATGPRFRLRADLSPVTAVERYAVSGPDGVRVLQFGKLRGHAGTLTRSQFAFRQIVEDLPTTSWSVIGDLPGGTRQPFFGWAGYADTVLVVVEPTPASLLSARRLARLAETDNGPRVVAIVNKVREGSEVDLVRESTRLEVVGAVPWDEALCEAERQGRAPIDHVPDGAAVQVVKSLARRLGAKRRLANGSF